MTLKHAGGHSPSILNTFRMSSAQRIYLVKCNVANAHRASTLLQVLSVAI